jgi:hypothetical protein
MPVWCGVLDLLGQQFRLHGHNRILQEARLASKSASYSAAVTSSRLGFDPNVADLDVLSLVDGANRLATSSAL